MRAAVGSLLALPIAAALVAVSACSEHVPAPPQASAPPELPSIISPDLRKNTSSSPVVFDPIRGGVWTANGDVGSISYVDVDARTVVEEVQIAQAGCGGPGAPCDVRSVALSPDGAWIAAVDRAGGSVTLLNAQTRETSVTIAVGAHPRACVWDAANPRWLYVVLEDSGSLAVVDRVLEQVVDTISVGRLPTAVAVSAVRRELYVSHRIDADLTIVDLRTRTVVADVPMADEPFSDNKTPNGKPLGFESFAITEDGRRAWLPHELLAPTHPFVFNETLFPAVSVVDLAVQVEVQTDRNSTNTDGRKNLFDGINLIGPDGQPQVFSQPCAVAMHPNALVGWVLACASEDILVFDVSEGVAIDSIRNLPIDHPAGMTLDDTGQRLFVMGDQSHTLITLDTAGGAVVQHTQLYGAPISLVKTDPVDPALRAGLTLFFRANTAKGSLATTADDWMSCAGCHLDGFGSANAAFFQALTPSDSAKDAEIGHHGLREHFSSRVPKTPSDPPFAPHDLLVALVDQGGLAPDRTGTDLTGQVDPSCALPSSSSPCSADALAMAQVLAGVVFRDLPEQPSWQHSIGDPNVAWDAQYCGDCHQPEYEAWRASVHAFAAADPMVRACVAGEQALAVQQGTPGARPAVFCAGCHDPLNLRAGSDLHLSPQGVTCISCHDVEREIRGGGNGDLQAVAHPDWGPMQDHKARGLASLELLRQPEFCGGCHQQFVPGTGFAAISTLDEYHASRAAGSTRCIDCHMRKIAGIADHRFPGGNVYLGQTIGDATLLGAQQQNLSAAVGLAAKRVANGVAVTVTNRGAAHSFPTGVTDIREPWVEVQAVNTSDPSMPMARYGGPVDGLLPADAARLGTDIAGSNGQILYHHEINEASRVPFDVRVRPGEAQSLFVPIPSALATASLRAVLYYRNVRTTYYRFATGDPNGHAPDVLVASVPVEDP